MSVFSMHPDDGGSIEDPVLLHQTATPGIGIGHSAAFTWNGEYVAIGHEPGGGGQARCQADQDPANHILYFMESRSDDIVGEWEIERKQGPTENCTIHNYNFVPTDKAYVLVGGHYQAGIAVVDVSDPANPYQFAYADPEPLSETSIVLGGSWSAYWYNGLIHDTDIRRGLISWRLSDPRVAGAMKLPYLNPQTQEFTIEKRPGVWAARQPSGPRTARRLIEPRRSRKLVITEDARDGGGGTGRLLRISRTECPNGHSTRPHAN